MESLISTLGWVGLDYDEGPIKDGPHGPYIQSQRNDKYQAAVAELLANKKAYHCFCTSEDLDAMRKKQEARHEAPMYDRRCLKLSPEEIQAKIAAGTTFVIRQLIPEGMLIIDDTVRGKVRFDSKTIDDQVLVKSDGFPTYHLANVVDDHDMEITHVIRGEEWLPSTPKHVWLYEAFGWTPPQFAHIPLLLNADRSKLSKRQGDVAVEEYIKKGYSREAIINFIAFLGWHPGKGIEKEIYSLEELITDFSLENVHKSGAIFNIEKLDWYNLQWGKKMMEEKLSKTQKTIANRGEVILSICDKYIQNEWKKNIDLLYRALVTREEKIQGFIFTQPSEKTMQERIEGQKMATEEIEKSKKDNIFDVLKFYFTRPVFKPEIVYSEKMNVTPEITKEVISAAIPMIEAISEKSTMEEWKNVLSGLPGNLNLKNGQVFWPIRAILTGEQFSPGVFEVIWALGKEETLERLKLVTK